MKTGLSLLAVLLGAAAAHAQPAGRLPPKDVEAIRSASLASAEAAMRKDFAGWFAIIADDIVLMPANAPAIVGRAAMEAHLRGFPPFKELRVEPIEIDGVGDLAYVRGRYSVAVTMPGGGEHREVGKYIEIWRRQADGAWKMTRDISNSDLPAPPPPRQP